MTEVLEMREIANEINENISIEKIDQLNQNAWDIRRSNLVTSWKFANNTEQISIIKSYDKGLAESLRTLAYCLWHFGEYPLSLEKSMFAVKLFRLLKDKKGEADALNIIGAVLFMYQGDNESRLKYNQLCLQLRIDSNDTEGIAGSENHIGETYMDMGDFVEADKWFTRCLNNPGAIGQFRALAHHNKGILFFRKKQYKEAITSFYKSLHLTDALNYDLLSVSTHLNIAKVLIESDVFLDEVDFHLNIALEMSYRKGLKEDLHKIFLAYSELEEKQGDISKAFKWFKKHNHAHNELFNEVNNRKINNIQTQFEIEVLRREAEFERIKHLELEKLIEQINIQKNEISRKNSEITDSIKYASRIQHAVLTTFNYIRKNSPVDFFIFYQPKDIVSGDFYWATRKDDKFYVAVCDSTGHGVPGAFMSLLNVSYLHEAINEKNKVEPNLILDYVRKRLIQNLSHEEQQDGMDGVLLCIDYSKKKITYAASYNAPIIIRNNKIIKLEADKMPIGNGIKTDPFKCYDLEYVKGDMIYLFTDGFADQFGGTKGKKLMNKNLYTLMAETAKMPIDQQSQKFKKIFEDWQGMLEQVDDVTIVGFKIDLKNSLTKNS
ncbi:MAG: hypothetical protein A3F72_15035 [Bacteroidetes bacterium RIFCSPLOWO2_12_FULL_35_15]|nr:MAG: hypothetical protein A3F72_15035 [Bacteroidetes bacterium RIFCSPLOWO2_12_FULL_35_15]